MSADSLGDGEGAAQVDVHNRVVLLERVLLDSHPFVHGRYIEQRVDAAELAHHVVHQPVDLFRPADVAYLKSDRMLAGGYLLSGLGQGVGLATGDDRLRLAFGKACGQGATDAAAAAGDQNDLVLHRKKLIPHVLLLLKYRVQVSIIGHGSTRG